MEAEINFVRQQGFRDASPQALLFTGQADFANRTLPWSHIK